MPNYGFCCTNDTCQYEFDVFAGMSEISDLKISCPECSATAARDYSQIRIYDGTPRTVGSIADRNSAQFSDDYKEHLIEKHKTKKVKRDK